MSRRTMNRLSLMFFAVLLSASLYGAEQSPPIRHSYLALGAATVIIDEMGSVVWEYDPGSRDGFVLPSGNVLLAFAKKVVEVTPDKKIVFQYDLSPSNSEISTAQRLYNGNTAIVEMGSAPQLLEVNPNAEIVYTTPLKPETDNAHMQTRMARQLRSGNYLAPHLLAFAIKEYTPKGEIVRVTKTDLDELGGRGAENWPFTAIRLDNGNTLVSLTHGNKVVEFDFQGSVVWKATNDDVNGLFNDPCGAQRLANGNTVVGSHGATKGISMIELTPARAIVWTSEHPKAQGVHHFQILSTNGMAEPGMPQK